MPLFRTFSISGSGWRCGRPNLLKINQRFHAKGVKMNAIIFCRAEGILFTAPKKTIMASLFLHLPRLNWIHNRCLRVSQQAPNTKYSDTQLERGGNRLVLHERNDVHNILEYCGVHEVTPYAGLSANRDGWVDTVTSFIDKNAWPAISRTRSTQSAHTTVIAPVSILTSHPTTTLCSRD